MISKNLIKTVRSLDAKKRRRELGLFVAEGPKVVGELLGRYTPRTIIATPERLRLLTNAADCERVEATADELRRASFLQHPQEVIALFELPDAARQSEPEPLSADELSLALDGVQDPGNVGTIIRAADWFGIRRVYCSPSTADAFAPKVVQATMGSLARVEVAYTDLESLITNAPAGTPVYGTLLDGSDIYAEPLTAGGLIVMGNEGNGLSEAIRRRVTRRLLVPHYGGGASAESLNVGVATALVCAEFRRRQHREKD